MNHWRIKAIHGQSHEPIAGVYEPIAGVYAELIAGRARMGWSNRDELDLRIIAKAVLTGQALTDEQKDAKPRLPFFEDIRVHDVLWYPKIPAAGRVTVVRVTGDYAYDHGINGVYDGGLGYDFRSVRPCEAVAPSLTLPGDLGPDVSQWLNAQGAMGRASPQSAVMLSKCLDRITETTARWRFVGESAVV